MSESYVKFGALLRTERERRGAKLEVIASDLKIPIETLQYLEAGQQDALPSELYFRLFAKSYSEYLGIDFTKTIEAIREELGELIEPQTPEQAIEAGRKLKAEAAALAEPVETGPSSKKGLFIWVSAAAVVVLAIAAYFIFSSKKPEPQAEVQPATVPSDYSTNQSDFGWDSTAQQRDSMLLTLTARVGSWATVLADGDTMVYQMLTPGRPYNVTARQQFVVTIGNPLVVDATLNGNPASLADPETGEVNQVEIDRSTVDMFAIPTDSADTSGAQPAATDSSAVRRTRTQSATEKTGGQ